MTKKEVTEKLAAPPFAGFRLKALIRSRSSANVRLGIGRMVRSPYRGLVTEWWGMGDTWDKVFEKAVKHLEQLKP